MATAEAGASGFAAGVELGPVASSVQAVTAKELSARRVASSDWDLI